MDVISLYDFHEAMAVDVSCKDEGPKPDTWEVLTSGVAMRSPH